MTFLKQPWALSMVLHVIFIVMAFMLHFRFDKKVMKQNIEIIEYPRAESKNLNLTPEVKPVPRPPPPQKKAVFGLSKNTLTSASPDTGGGSLKVGNTVAKTPDQDKLDPLDEGSLPIPEDEYLLSSMPSLISEVRISYPSEARINNIEGPVVMDLLIDQEGKVRKVDMISGPGHGLNEAAAEAVKHFKFRPGQVGEKKVAVKIRYTYRFVLENR